MLSCLHKTSELSSNAYQEKESIAEEVTAPKDVPQIQVEGEDSWLSPFSKPDQPDGGSKSSAAEDVGFYIGETHSTPSVAPDAVSQDAKGKDEEEEEEVPKGSFWSQLAELDKDEPPLASPSLSRIPHEEDSFLFTDKGRERSGATVQFHLGDTDAGKGLFC